MAVDKTVHGIKAQYKLKYKINIYPITIQIIGAYQVIELPQGIQNAGYRLAKSYRQSNVVSKGHIKTEVV